MSKKTNGGNGSASAKAEGAAAPSAPASAPTSIMPLLYNKVEFLNGERHGKIRYQDHVDYGFVAKANYIPVTAMEFADAAAHYPIVFAGAGQTLEPVVITGRNKGENQQVGKDGKWRGGSYVPAYVRRYPFILITGPQADTLSLGADLTAANLRDGEAGAALYEGGKPSETAKRALQFCLGYQQAALATSSICQAIDAAGLLIERSAEFTLPSGKSRVAGFKIVDEAAFNALSDEQFLTLRKAGALPAIYLHLLSMKAWRNLLD